MREIIVDAEQTMAMLKKHHFRGIKEMVAAAPELLRCKDCFREQECKEAQWLGENGYCSYAERKDDEA